jgi:hypothetical protein
VEGSISSELYEEIISGRTTRERKLAVCSGSARLVAAERAELLAVLAEDGDEMVRERAGNSILEQPIEGFVTALKGDAPASQLFRFCGRNLIDQPEIAAALAKHWRCPPEFVTGAAKRLPTSAVQELMGDLEKLSASPLLVAALLHSASLTADQRVQLEELMRETTESESAFVEGVAEAEIDPARRISLIQRLSQMRVVERVQLGLKGNREERIALIRDPCKVVQRAVLQSSRITDREVETFASMASLSDDVLRLISANRNFMRNYTVVRNLITNPKTPVDVSLHLLPIILATDLKALSNNKNVPETLRNSANRLQRQRTEKRD